MIQAKQQNPSNSERLIRGSAGSPPPSMRHVGFARPLAFAAKKGKPIIVEAGLYRVEASDDGRIVLVSDTGEATPVPTVRAWHSIRHFALPTWRSRLAWPVQRLLCVHHRCDSDVLRRPPVGRQGSRTAGHGPCGIDRLPDDPLDDVAGHLPNRPRRQWSCHIRGRRVGDRPDFRRAARWNHLAGDLSGTTLLTERPRSADDL